jgi:hypothetical protein
LSPVPVASSLEKLWLVRLLDVVLDHVAFQFSGRFL